MRSTISDCHLKANISIFLDFFSNTSTMPQAASPHIGQRYIGE
ncbi:MAG TPA: hypothetical protein DEF41_07935 [Desulfovibrio sp.]|nr:hypothetical protein [Desulfovibrio sp.]